MVNSPARYDIGTPGRSSEMEDEVGIEDGPARASALRFFTLERNPATQRDVEDEDDTMGDHNKHLRVTDDDDTMDSIGKMDDDDRRILTAAISEVDIVEVYSPVRVAAVAAKFGFTPGTSFDLTNG